MSVNRERYFGYINDRLSALAVAIENGGKSNVLGLHSHAEDFYGHLLNELYGWDLRNLNESQHNAGAIDLISEPMKIVAQVSSTCTRAKIKSALSKGTIKRYAGYNFKFVSISKDASALRKADFGNVQHVVFDPSQDIYDIASILAHVKGLSPDRLKSVYDLIKKELGQETEATRLESNLAAVVNFLAKEDLSKNDQPITVNSFEIERKVAHNKLDGLSGVIDEFKVHHSRLDRIYAQFDASGANKSTAVLSAIGDEYQRNKKASRDVDLFYLVRDNVQRRVAESPNFDQIPAEELELCVNIIVVDAFIRCKIFENPENHTHAAA
jgi:hypothetical protein